MAYDRQGNWVAEDVQSPYTQRNVQQPGNAGWMVGNNGQTAGINSEGRMSDYDRMALDNGVSSANAESAIAESQYGLNTNRKVERDNDITGSAMRINKGADPAIYGAGGLKGKQVVNTYDPDRPASMGAQGNNPWQDMARQLATFSELRNREPMSPGYNSLTDQNAIDNDEKTRRWAMEDAARHVPFAQRGQAMLQALNSIQSNQTQRRGQDIQAANAATGAGVQTRGQDMQYRSHMEGLGLQGRNQRDLADLQGRNQLANTELAYGMQGMNQMAHDQRLGENARGLEKFKQQLDDGNPLKAAQAKAYEAHAKLYGTQSEVAQRNLEFDKSADGSIQKWMKLYADMGLPHEQALQESIKRHLGSKRAYAEGGQVESPEQVMARIQAKYGVSGNAPQPQAQAPAPQPVRQQAPAPQQPTGGLMDRLRNVATGGLDRRMQAAGYAEGGPIEVGGRPVVGAGNGKSDSLPAVIDGEHPAALSTGEFVMPIEAVRHFGLDKLNKMVAAARKGLDTGRDSA